MDPALGESMTFSGQVRTPRDVSKHQVVTIKHQTAGDTRDKSNSTDTALYMHLHGSCFSVAPLVLHFSLNACFHVLSLSLSIALILSVFPLHTHTMLFSCLCSPFPSSTTLAMLLFPFILPPPRSSNWPSLTLFIVFPHPVCPPPHFPLSLFLSASRCYQ